MVYREKGWAKWIRNAWLAFCILSKETSIPKEISDNVFMPVDGDSIMLQFYFSTLINYIFLYYKEAVILGIVFCCMNQTAGFFFRDYQKKNSVILFLYTLYMYSVFVITIKSRLGSDITEVNLLPLLFLQKYKWEKMCFVVNIALFLPMPIFLYILYPIFRKFGNSVLLGFVVSVGIESLQYMLHCGWCDIDDVLSNTLGVALGWVFVHGITFLGRKCVSYRKKGNR